MGRERQKQKRKSSFPRVRMKPKSKKLNIKGSQIIASNWDRFKTLDQNYRRLGLTPRLKGRPGGTEKASGQSHDPNDSLRMPDAVSSAHPEVRVQRDPETGAILQVMMPDGHSPHNPLNDPLNELSDEDKEGSTAGTSAGILGQLEQEASRPSRGRTHPESLWEKEWTEKLVRMYGTDFGRMVRDRKLNPYQWTETDIRKRVARWQGQLGSGDPVNQAI